ncbi:MAG: 3-deoxy-manno-octulosonate cytidylyltransferase, partial [Rikenellaceae bacterium]
CFLDKKTDIATLVKPFEADEDIFNPNSPKVTLSNKMFALYFSRSAIPFIRGSEKDKWQAEHQFYKHIGLYAYRTDVLREITELQMGDLEKCESLEQLRWLENGYRIKCSITTHKTYAIDTPEDLKMVLEAMKNV